MRRSLMLLDDEPLVLDSLVHTVPWEELDCYVVASAQNGAEGKRLLDALRPDILVTDIVMPGMSGIELAEYCASRYPHCKVILLSAHADFAYAQQAMRFGVSHYVLKPIDTEKLMGAVRQSKAELDDEQHRAAQLGELEELAASAQHLASTSLLFDIARFGNSIAVPEKELLKQMKNLRPGVVIAVQLFNTPVQGSGALPAAQKYYRDAFAAQNYELICGSTDMEISFLCPLCEGPDRQTGRERVLSLLRQVRNNSLPEQLGISVAAVSDSYSDFTSLHRAYIQCIQMLGRGFFCGVNTVFNIQEQASPVSVSHPPDDILHHMRHGNLPEMADALSVWRTALLRQGEKEPVIYALRELHRQATLQASQAGMTEKPSGKRLYQNENFDAMFNALREYLESICGYMLRSQNLVGRMQLFVEESYANPELNLTMLSDALSANSSYLSRLFKKEFGENFSDHLLRIRIERARFLLKTTRLKNNEISKQVGFEDDHYFSQVFKKSCGLTPKQYRESTEHKA